MHQAQRIGETEPPPADSALHALGKLDEAIENGDGGDVWREALFSLRRQLGAQAGVRLLEPVEARSALPRLRGARRAHP